MPAAALLLLVPIVILAWGLWAASIRFAADVDQVEAPDGRWYDVLTHREGVMLYTKTAAYTNAYSVFPTAVALIRRRMRAEPWSWAVIVRPSPFRGYKDLLHEVYGDRETADRRAVDVASAIKQGARLWPDEAAWFR